MNQVAAQPISKGIEILLRVLVSGNACDVYCAGAVLFNLRRRNSIAQSAAMVRMSLVMCVARTRE